MNANIENDGNQVENLPKSPLANFQTEKPKQNFLVVESTYTKACVSLPTDFNNRHHQRLHFSRRQKRKRRQTPSLSKQKPRWVNEHEHQRPNQSHSLKFSPLLGLILKLKLKAANCTIFGPTKFFSVWRCKFPKFFNEFLFTALIGMWDFRRFVRRSKKFDWSARLKLDSSACFRTKWKKYAKQFIVKQGKKIRNKFPPFQDDE